MEASSFENLRRFFEKIKSIGFFERLFSWNSVTSLGYDAAREYQQLSNRLIEQERMAGSFAAEKSGFQKDLEHSFQQIAALQQNLTSEKSQVALLSSRIADRERESATLAESDAKNQATILQLKGDLVELKSKNEELVTKIAERESETGGLRQSVAKDKETIQKLNTDIQALTAKYDLLNNQFTESQKELAQFRQKDEERVKEHDQRVTELMSLRKQLEDDRIRIEAERNAEIYKQFEEMEKNWKKHEDEVEQTLRTICQRHTISYCDKEQFPVSGKKPDNAIVICDQYVIFDAKSPKNSDELNNFPQYIRNQAEAAKKYTKEESVKKEIFLVVPANTVKYINEFHLDMADYQVYIVTHDCLEPIILALRKIEDYQFVDQLSPEDRENICHVIGRFAHATKRRIQIDNYFSNEFIRLLQGCSSLPEDILKKVVDYEKAEKLNPPIEKRKKLIPIKEIEHDVKVIGKEAEAREIDLGAVTKEKIETIPLDKYLE
jgi:hypothetical protein